MRHTKKEDFTMNSTDSTLWNPVVGSSQIKEEYYDKKNKRLFLKFSNGSIYSYEIVEKEVYDSFINAPSAGGYFHTKIKHLTTTKIKNKDG